MSLSNIKSDKYKTLFNLLNNLGFYKRLYLGSIEVKSGGGRWIRTTEGGAVRFTV